MPWGEWKRLWKQRRPKRAKPTVRSICTTTEGCVGGYATNTKSRGRAINVFQRNIPRLVNSLFWMPSPRRSFRAPVFSPFIFKLRAPYNAICGYACFAHFSRRPPDWLAWETFGIGNGCPSFEEMHARITKGRTRIGYEQQAGYDEIGSIRFVSPNFLFA